jgi:lipid II:glycine glycyltransferase (peptidoglycan interpeptide bridge formation enzyme)
VISFLQSDHWKTFQQAYGRKTFSDTGKDWSYLAIKETGTLNTRLYTPYGPYCLDIDGLDEALASLQRTAKKEHATFIRVEPTQGITTDQLRIRGFRPVTYQQLQPSHTQMIDLTQPEEAILANMSQNSRNITRNYHKKGISIRTSYDPADIQILTSLLARVASRNHITPHGDDYFKQQATTLFPLKAAVLYIAEYEDIPIAAALVFDSETTRIYAHAAADDAYRKLSAGTALVGQMILDAKRIGLTQFDLYGITDSADPNHPWAGFTKFKRSFGGHSVAYPGAWDLPLRKPSYWLYRIYQSIRQTVR